VSSDPSGPDLTVVVVSWNTCDLVLACLASIAAAAAPYTVETIVVDNASADGTVEAVRERFPSVRVIANVTNAGFTRANNQALAVGKGQFFLLLNSDTEARPGSLATMIRYLETHPDAGACGPKLLFPDGRLQPNGRRLPTFWREFLAASGLRRLNPSLFADRLEWGRTDFDRTVEVDEVSGACLMVRREVVRKVGPLDEQLFMFYEEVDWCARMKAAGWKVAYVAEAEVIHHMAQSVSKAGFDVYRAFYASQFRYHRKHGSPPVWIGMRLVSWLNLAKRYGLFVGSRVKRRLDRRRQTPDARRQLDKGTR
jgi:N-acetylglucosaminyl-diphospho-decaprenol L-rhamnosyltransferase